VTILGRWLGSLQYVFVRTVETVSIAGQGECRYLNG